MKSLIFFLIFGMAIIACEQPLFNTLPPETQEGRGTFGCEIDGEIWRPSKDLPFDTGPSANIDDTTITLHATGQLEQINIYVGGGVEEKLYLLNSNLRPRGRYKNGERNNTSTYLTDKSHIGELHIKKYDTINQILSGTFWFDAVNSDGEKVEVRDGRFDLIYNSN